MKTIQEVEHWRQQAEMEYGNAALPVGQLFVRYVEGDSRPTVDEYFDLFCFWENNELVLWLGPDLIVPIEVSDKGALFDQGELRAFGASAITTGLWALTPSLNLPGVIHGFITLYDVPSIPPWVRRIVLVGEVA